MSTEECLVAVEDLLLLLAPDQRVVVMQELAKRLNIKDLTGCTDVR